LKFVGHLHQSNKLKFVGLFDLESYNLDRELTLKVFLLGAGGLSILFHLFESRFLFIGLGDVAGNECFCLGGLG